MGASSSVSRNQEIDLDRECMTCDLAFFEQGNWSQHFGGELTESGSILLRNEYELPDGVDASSFQFNSVDKTVDNIPCENMLTPQRVVAALFPYFLQSEEYEEWVSLQTSASDSGVVEQAKRIGRLKSLFSEIPHALNPSLLPNTVVADALKSITVEHVRKFESSTWLESLVAMVEDLPLCVAISTADKKCPGFPLIYVNKAFENMTGYDRSEILNQNCRFLQSSNTEADQIERMTQALCAAKPVKVAITNVRKDGTEFGNLLAMKPIFDDKGVYTYVIGVQCDISDPTISRSTVKLVEDLLSILPNVLT